MGAMAAATTQNVKEIDMNKTFSTIAISSVIGLASLAQPTHAAVIDQVKNKVDAIKTDTGTLKSRTSAIVAKSDEIILRADELSHSLNTVIDMSNVTQGLANHEAMNAVIESTAPLVELVVAQQRDYQSFPAESFRSELTTTVDALFALPEIIRGSESDQKQKIHGRISEAHPFFLYALSKTPLTRVMERASEMSEELVAISNFAQAAREHVAQYYPEEAVRMARVQISLAAPEYVSCSFVLDNVTDEEISAMKLSKLRAKQINGLMQLTTEFLPEDQTVGVTAVGGATLSIPNVVKPIVVEMGNAAEEYGKFLKTWLEKVDSCESDALDNRLSAFLDSQDF
jgi:hypothetical protein